MYRSITNADRIQRYRAFWQRAETDRPLIGTTISTFPSVRAISGQGILTPSDISIAESLKELDEEWEQWRDVGGDAIWSAAPIWAFPWEAAMAGCPIQRDEQNIWTHPVEGDWEQLERLRFDAANPWFQHLMRCLNTLLEHAGERYAVGGALLSISPADLMMKFRGQQRLALDLYDAPEMVAQLSELCLRFCLEVTEAILAKVPQYLGGYTGTLRYFWAPGRMVETSEDISFMLSLPAHERLVVPILRGIGQRFPYTIVHLHSAQLHTVPNLLEIDELAAIEVTPDYGEDMLPHLGILQQILERKPLIVHGVMSLPSVQEMIHSLPSRGLALFCRCDTPNEAADVLNTLLR